MIIRARLQSCQSFMPPSAHRGAVWGTDLRTCPSTAWKRHCTRMAPQSVINNLITTSRLLRRSREALSCKCLNSQNHESRHTVK
eukprot:4878300-Amphidinium_carterae.1